jgi:hypothetical protein
MRKKVVGGGRKSLPILEEREVVKINKCLFLPSIP